MIKKYLQIAAIILFQFVLLASKKILELLAVQLKKK